MITFRHLSLRRGVRLLFEHVTLAIHAGQKIGVTGANGCGKSSLFALLRGELHADAGDLDLPPRMTFAHVAQETPASDRAAIEYVLDGDRELREIEVALAEAERSGDAHGIGELHARLDDIGGYGAPARGAQLMSGLGFRPDDGTRAVKEFSGGWRMRLNLAQALMSRADLLLLDEPTNHLDLDAVLWLERWLKSTPGTLLLISHDRDFLDNVVDGIAHIEARQVRLYSGGYSDFERQRAARLALQQAAFEKQQREIAHLESYIERFRAKATKARQAQSRIKALERMELISAAHVDSPFHFAFRPPQSCGSPLLRLERTAAGYGDAPVVRDVNVNLLPGARVGLLGPNGAGKSTLVKLMAGELSPLAGKRLEAKGLKIGYFAQHQLEQLRPEDSPVKHLQRLSPEVREQDLRDYLGGFDFTGDKALAPVEPFSGGEKARLVLALLVWQRPSLLLLDEPTNHLDLEMRHALTLALQEFEGALVVVSHDRHLLRTCTDELLLVADGTAQEFAGDLDDYRDWLASRSRSEPSAGARSSPGADRRQQKRLEAERRNERSAKRRPVEKRIAELEREMDRLNEEKDRLDAALADGGMYAEEQKEALKGSLQRQVELATRLAEIEEEWLALQEELEALVAPES
ncbi:MAG: ATP-binding cassette domain-containing protein [Betaproteobacteria bacterium]|nr:ATP-binding cassette domain-containing protein [Betaproteobacteria bacterium]